MFTADLQSIAVIIVSICNIAIAAYVLKRRGLSVVPIAFFVFVLGTTVWASGVALIYLTGNFFFDKVIFSGAIPMVFGITLFARVFPNKEAPRKKWYLLFLPWVVVAASIPFDLLVTDIIVHDRSIEPINGPLMPLFAGCVAFYFLLSCFYFIRTYRNTTSYVRLQLRYLFSGVLVLIFCTAVFSTLLPAIGIFQFNLLGPLSSFVFVALVAYVMIRHDLMDIKIVIQRGVVYVLVLGVVVAWYLGIIFLLGSSLVNATSQSIVVSGLITTLVGIFGVPILERWLRRVTDHIFFKDRYDYADTLHTLAEKVNTNANFDDLIQTIEETLRQVMRVTDAEVLLGESKGRIVSPELVVPITLSEKTLGRLVLNKKRSGDRFDQQDRLLLGTFAQNVATTLERVRLYQEVLSYSKTLETRVMERTAQIASLQEEQQRMIADLSHGLQTPLTIMQSTIDVLPELPEQTMSQLKASITRLSRYVSGLLKLSRLEFGDQNGSVSEANISAVVEEVVEYFTLIAKEKNIDLKTKIDKDLFVTLTEAQAEEVVTNLMSNAYKYIPENATTRSINVELLRKNEYAELTITDTGVGISTEDISKIFERFRRGTSEEVAHVDGAGIGLALTKRLVEHAQGTIEVSSVLGRGTVVTVILPLKNKI